jgi:hypothetical protein
MNNRIRTNWSFNSIAVFLLLIFLQSCVEENIEDKFLSESVASQEYYIKNVLPVMNNKCFSCHTYHTSSGTRYDTYSKAAAVAEEMVNRTSSKDPNLIMPPPSAEPLTEEEVQVFQQFYQSTKVNGEVVIEAEQKINQEYSVSLSWTAYKFSDFKNRIGVSGTFEEAFITYKYKEAANIYEFLQEAEILIPVNSTNIENDPLKTFNVLNHFFSYFTPVIHGKIMHIDAPNKNAKVIFNINGLSQEVIFHIEEVKEDLVFTGQIQDIRYFNNAQTALDALQQVCGEYHQGKVWPDIDLKAEIKNFRTFTDFQN